MGTFYSILIIALSVLIFSGLAIWIYKTGWSASAKFKAALALLGAATAAVGIVVASRSKKDEKVKVIKPRIRVVAPGEKDKVGIDKDSEELNEDADEVKKRLDEEKKRTDGIKVGKSILDKSSEETDGKISKLGRSNPDGPEKDLSEFLREK